MQHTKKITTIKMCNVKNSFTFVLNMLQFLPVQKFLINLDKNVVVY